MDALRQANDEQVTLWNGSVGRGWVEAQPLLDAVLQPFEDLLVAAVQARSARRVLDVGCGAGATTLGVARLLASKGHCVGIDISAPMIAVARARAARVGSAADFICADAQTHSFGQPAFDMIISRFGAMFFDDSVAALANLRRTASDDAELRFIAWRSAAENPFMTAAERAAAPLLPNLPAREADAPGQFAFADRNRVRGILEESRWVEIDIKPIDVTCQFPEAQLVRYFTQLGPLARILHEADERTSARVIATVRAAFDPYVHAEQVRFDAACWMVCARAASSIRAAARA